MAITEAADYVTETPASVGIAGAVRGVLAEIVRRHRKRQAIAQVSRLGSRLIDDIGFDPGQLDSGKGTWDGIPSRWPDWHPPLPR